jgi:CRP-like cAMP-binding protein
LLCKLGSIMVAQQNHALILGRNDAQGKLAMFLDAWERGQRERGYDTEMIYLPMSRSDIAAYVGLTVEAVSRTFTAFAVHGLVSFRAKRQVRLIDRAGLHALIGVATRPRRTAHAPQNPAFAQP